MPRRAAQAARPSAVSASAIRSQLTNAFRISAGDSATISACQRRSAPAARAVAITPTTAQTARIATVTSKNSRPLIVPPDA